MKNRITIIIAAVIAVIFGLLTIFAGGSVITGLFGMREKEGHYILFVVWANFVCGILYLAAAYGFFKRKKWTLSILNLSFWILVAAFIAFLIWVINKEPYETKTFVALSFRMLLTLALAWVARVQLRIPNSEFRVKN
jgi:hypothetical protein